MEKLVYLLWGEQTADDGDRLRATLLDDLAPTLLERGVAEISVWVDAYDRRGPLDDLVAAAAPGLDLAGYLVVESLYDDYGTTPHAPPRSWGDGERSPGVLTVALIHRPEGLDEAEWVRRWHGIQSPVSAELQPRTRYVRNRVVQAITSGAPPIDGIVEEGWPAPAHVADPFLFFNAEGDADLLNANIARMMESVESCLDLARLRNVTMSEHLVRTIGS